jgi:predicted nucleic-acid-binding protein
VIGLDTNVLVRYLTQDDPRQSRAANALVAEAVAGGKRLFVGAVVLCEMVWVLRESYGLAKAEIVSALERLLATTQLEIDEKDLVRAAIEDYRRGPGDFADYVIGRVAREAGCERTATFDRRLKRSTLFRMLGAPRAPG